MPQGADIAGAGKYVSVIRTGPVNPKGNHTQKCSTICGALLTSRVCFRTRMGAKVMNVLKSA